MRSRVFSKINSCSYFILGLIFTSPLVTGLLTSFCSGFAQTGTQSPFFNFTPNPSYDGLYVVHVLRGNDECLHCRKVRGWWGERELKVDFRPLRPQTPFKPPFSTAFLPAYPPTVSAGLLCSSCLPFPKFLFTCYTKYLHKSFFLHNTVAFLVISPGFHLVHPKCVIKAFV